MALDFVAGCLGGCAGVLVGHPFDTIKVHLQTQCAKNPQYRGTFDCLRKIVARDSVRGLYRGMASPLGGVAFVNAIVFGVYGNVQRYIGEPNSLQAHFIAGSTAGLIQSLICSPMELAKTRIQLLGQCPHAVRYKGPLHCLNYIRKTEGLRGVFRGLGITAVRDVPGFSSYFVSYELMMSLTSNPSGLYTLMAGGLAGTFSWLLTFPIDVIKSRLQVDGMAGQAQYSGIRDCMRKGYQSEGMAFYLRGLSSTLIRAFPMNAACFFVVSTFMRACDRTRVNVEVQKSEPLLVVKSTHSPAPVAEQHKSSYFRSRENHHESTRRRSALIKSLVFFGAFHEAVCSTEIIELANDLYDDQYSYYNFNTESFNYSPTTSAEDCSLLETVMW